jgi:transposase
MSEDWMTDARKIPDQTMSYLRKIAVAAIRHRRISPEIVADVLGISRSAIYEWLRREASGGLNALDTGQAPGAPPVITPAMDDWLRDTVRYKTPRDFGYDVVLWNRHLLAELLKKEFGVPVGDSTVSLHLRQLGLSYRKPWFRAAEQNPRHVERFLNETFPRIQKLAKKIQADIAFEDEAGVGLQTHAGKTWGPVGQEVSVPVTARRGGLNVLSAITATGWLRFSIHDGKINADRYIEFLEQLLAGRSRPLIVIVDRAPFHRAKKVRDFVRAHRTQIRVYFLPSYSPELNPDEQVWNLLKSKMIGKTTVKNKPELKRKIESALGSIQQRVDLVKSFFQLQYTKYAGLECTDNC